MREDNEKKKTEFSDFRRSSEHVRVKTAETQIDKRGENVLFDP